jgi:hypothetical protein
MDGERAQQYARIAGMLYLVSIAAGGIGEPYISQTLPIANDLGAVAHRAAVLIGPFRASFRAYLIEACSELTLDTNQEGWASYHLA